MNRSETQALCQQFDIRPTRSLGQNFLTDSRVVGLMLQVLALDTDELVIEIGAGLGTLTRQLATQAGQVRAIEIDHHLIPALQQVMSGSGNCAILQQDALKTNLAALSAEWTGPVSVAANLPYYITTPLVEKILCELPYSRQLMFMVQDEAVERLLAKPGSKAYSPLAVLIALYGDARRLFQVPADAFWPRPHVASAIVHIRRHEASDHDIAGAVRQNDAANRDLIRFLSFLNNCFRQRRKTLVNNLKQALTPDRSAVLPEILARIGLAPAIRAEAISPQLLWQLFCLLFSDRS